MVFGIPSNPQEFPDFPELLMTPSLGGYKTLIANQVLVMCLARAHEEAKQRIREIITRDGLNALIEILEGESIFGELQEEG